MNKSVELNTFYHRLRIFKVVTTGRLEFQPNFVFIFVFLNQRKICFYESHGQGEKSKYAHVGIRKDKQSPMYCLPKKCFFFTIIQKNEIDPTLNDILAGRMM